MSSTSLGIPRHTSISLRFTLTGLATVIFSFAQPAVQGGNPTAPSMYQPAPQPGGVPAQSHITSITPAGTNTVICWSGLPGWYGVEMSGDGATGWAEVGRTAATDYHWCLSVTNGGNPAAFFRLNQNNAYTGSGGCSGCHGAQFSQWLNTPHASALTSLDNIGMGNNPACLGCHTVGYGQPGGFTDAGSTPALRHVGCESCHGPAAWHKYSDHELIRPPATIAAELCGGCHTDAHHPTFDEWQESPHSAVTAELQAQFSDPAGGQARQMACGACHSGAVRMALLKHHEATLAGHASLADPPVLPSLTDAAGYGVTCVNCHDPHATNANPAQLRHPLFSTNFYSFSTTTVLQTNITFLSSNTYYLNTPFSTQYVASVQLCGQCHNQRGAVWTSNTRPPHHSPQYNLLIGNVAFPTTNAMIGAHGLRNPKQCVQCHMAGHGPDLAYPVGDTNRFYTGHTFRLTLTGCTIAGCHSSTNRAAEMMIETQSDTENRIHQVVTLLQTWGATKSPTTLRSNYGQYAWEYVTAGQLSSPTPAGTLTNGPSAALQAQIPEAIRKARFALYLVAHDASKGVHNGDYTRFLLNFARTNVQAELNKP
jgi:hypothetical protein